MPAEREVERVRRLKVLHVVVLGLCGAVIALGVLVIPLVGRVASQSNLSCMRALEFAPYVAKDDARRRVFPTRVVIDGKVHNVQQDYLTTIPKSCG